MKDRRLIEPSANQKSGPVGLSQPPAFEIDYPVFCFRHLKTGYDFEACKKDHRFLKGFVDRVRILSALTWTQIQFTDRQGTGSEKISINSLNPAVPKSISDDVKDFLSFYFAGNKGRMIGYRNGMIFHVVYLDVNLSVYDHS